MPSTTPHSSALIANVSYGLAAELPGLPTTQVEQAVRVAKRELEDHVVPEELPEMLRILARHRLVGSARTRRR